MKIEYPAEEEMNHTISAVVEKAYPKRENVLVYLVRLYRKIGLEFLLHGMREMMIVVIAVYALMVWWQQSNVEQYMVANTSLSVVCFSPIVFQAILALFILGEKEQHTYELELTCRYTVYHVLILRMLLVSILCIMFNAAFFMAVFWKEGTAEMLHMVFLSATSLFLYGLLYLNLLIKSSQLKYQILLYDLWMAGNSLAMRFIPSIYLFLAAKIPILFHVAVWILCAVLFGRKLNRFVYCNCKYNLYVGE